MKFSELCRGNEDNLPVKTEKSMNPLNKFSREFLEALLDEELPLPWNPADPEAEAFLAEREQDFSLTDALESEEITSRAQTLFEAMDNSFRRETQI